MGVFKDRIDKVLVTRGLVESREKARALLMEGKVLVRGMKVEKAGTFISKEAPVEIISALRYASRGGLKLEKALKEFSLNISGLIALDVGASTGGFTDCLLQHGAQRVYAIDVGYGQLDWKLRNDPRVVLIERTNIRYMKMDLIKDDIDFSTVDVSFISLVKVLPKVHEFLKSEGKVVALIKPQFELERADVGKGGIVRDEHKRLKAQDKIKTAASAMGFAVKGLITSPIKGSKGNEEYLIYLSKT
jgi:23S rRNA (cytidine1920-2'-O)/16S rRNA (cytidine1409-2'-O)-methyltransferase